jgi:hypothetical protein
MNIGSSEGMESIEPLDLLALAGDEIARIRVKIEFSASGSIFSPADSSSIRRTSMASFTIGSLLSWCHSRGE